MTSRPDAMRSQPNIVYLHSHDTGRYVSPYGFGATTPNIGRLAEEGVLFRKAFCVAPTCSPSRAALATGTYPHENGMLGLAHRGFSLKDYDQHIVHTLRNAGYHTVLAGLQHVATDSSRIGYDEVIPTRSKRVEHVAPAAVDVVSRGPAQPFFLDIGFFETHRPFPEPEPQHNPGYVAPPTPLPDTPEVRRDMAGYQTSVQTLDAGIGAVLDALKRHGLEEQTLVICTTDHGIAFPHMKCNLTDHGTGVMLIMRGPEGFSGGKVVDAMVSHLDLFPTICDLAGIDAPERLRGTSLAPLVRGQAETVHDELYAEVNYHAAYEPQRCIRTDRWKYIRRYDARVRRVIPNTDAGPSESLLTSNGWNHHPQADEYLYDLLFDPNETNNLAGELSASMVLNDMRKRLERWMCETGDPLRHGPIPKPTGSRVDDPNYVGSGR